MKVLNIHERQIKSNPHQAGQLLDTLAGEGDKLWPWEHWPPMKLDAPLGKGARGGHGPVRYSVREYIPGEKAAFVFENQGLTQGFNGGHFFEILPEADSVVFRHVIDMQCGVGTWLKWVFMVRPLHDALLEDSFDKVESSLTGTVDRKAEWSAWVRVLRWLIRKKTGASMP
jgi:hypothetical protein